MEKRTEIEETRQHLLVGLEKIHETVVQVEQLQASLAVKRKELNDKNEEANLKLKQMVHDQQEAEKKRIGSQELQVILVVCIDCFEEMIGEMNGGFRNNKNKSWRNARQ